MFTWICEQSTFASGALSTGLWLLFKHVCKCACVCMSVGLSIYVDMCVCCVCPVKPRKRNWIKAEKKGPSNVSNCEVKMVVICVHGMLAGTSESANRHDFCWKLVFGLGLLSLLRLLKIFDCHFARYDFLEWNFMLPPSPMLPSPSNICTTITIHFNQTKNIYALCKFEIEIEQIKIIKQCVDTNAHCPSLCLGLESHVWFSHNFVDSIADGRCLWIMRTNI